MPTMLDMIRNSQVPANLMHSAARGSLSVPPAEMIAILVHLALHNKAFGAQAKLTLAAWDEKSSLEAAANPATSAEVLDYLASPENLRSSLLPALANNSAVNEKRMSQLAAQGSRSVVEALLGSSRVMSSPGLLKALQSNGNLRPNELAAINAELAKLETGAPLASHEEEGGAPEPEVAEALERYLRENATELAAEKDKAFQAIEGVHEEETGATEAPPPAAPTAPAEPVPASVKPPAAPQAAPQTPALPAKKHPHHIPNESRDSTLMKIAKLNIQGRIALAMRGTKEERSILIRDATKLVCLAVLDSPKVSDAEVEKFALQKNVLEAVLRAIPMKRKYAKNYSILRNLVFNPRTPMDVSLGLMKNLLVHDLKNLSGNKEVSETIRKLALRMFKQKMEKKG